MQGNYEIKGRIVTDEFGSYISISRSVAPIVIEAMSENDACFSVNFPEKSSFATVFIPPKGDVDLLAQAIHDAETGASLPVGGDDGESLKIAIEQFAKYLGCADFAAAMYDDSYSEDVAFSSERAHLDFLDEKAALVKSALLAKFQEIVASALGDQNAEVPDNLIRDNANDGSSYTLREGADGVWIRAENIDARVYLSNGGVVADLYPAHLPTPTPVASAYVSFGECEDEQG